VEKNLAVEGCKSLHGPRRYWYCLAQWKDTSTWLNACSFPGLALHPA
jgi:hypothetical protein